MADYKLKLEIDAAELQKQLETAFKKGIKGFSGGGSQGSNTVAGQKYFKQEEKMKKQMNKLTLEEKKELEKHTYTLKTEYAKQKSLLRAQNIMLEKSGVQQARTFRMIGSLLGGRMGGSAGAAMDQGITYFMTQRRRRQQVKDTQQAYDRIGPGPLAGINRGPRPEQESNIFNAMADIGARVKDSPIGEFLGSTKKTFEDKVPGAKQAGGIAGKVGSKIPQAVKIAGIGAALAGGAGLAKMIIDSSPMLKSMLKILNVGIMLILRPIGDFIGFMLRPLLVEFVKKVAVPAYKKGAVWAKEWGDKAGKALLGFFNDPIGTISTAIEEGMKYTGALLEHALRSLFNVFGTYKAGDENYDRIQSILNPQTTADAEGSLASEMNKFMDDPWSTSDKLDNVKKAQQDMYPWLQTETELLCGVAVNTATTNELLQEMPEKIAAAQVEAAKQQAADALKKQEAEMEKQRQEAAAAAAAAAAEAQAAFEERTQTPFAPGEPDFHLLPKGGISVAGQKAIAAYEAWKKGEAWAGGAAQAGGRFGAVDPLDTDKMGGMTGTGVFEKYDPEDGSTCMASREIFEYENFAADSRAQMEAYSEAIEESVKTGGTIKEEYDKILEETIKQMQNAKMSSINTRLIKESTCEAKTNVVLMTDATKSMADNLDATAKYVASLLKRAYNVKKDNGKRRYPWAGPQAAGLDSAFGGSGSGSTREKYRITLVGGETIEQILDPTSYKYIMNLRNQGKTLKGKPILSIMKMAAGGLITEPIFGIGQNTGKGYLMGEAGPERVTPGTGPAKEISGGNTFNITINATNVGDVERQLKPAILKILKESTSRAGIV